ncbi:MAG TPA: hypothetical protein VFG52_09100, partial [Xanthomonadales bacterium]|nr:hypothetical protein [Xanthomonadales bacterium]
MTRAMYPACLVAVFLLVCSSVFAQDNAAGPQPANQAVANSTAPETDADAATVDALPPNASTSAPETNQRWMFDLLSNTTIRPARSLLVDREMPLVGIKWGADLQGDIPLNSEPGGAQATLRE